MSELSPPAEAFVGHLVFLPGEQLLQGAGRGPVTRPAYPAFQARAAHPGGAQQPPRTGCPVGGAHPAGGAYPALPPAEQAAGALRVAAARLRRVTWCIVRGRIPPAPVPAAITAEPAGTGGGADVVTTVREAAHHDAFLSVAVGAERYASASAGVRDGRGAPGAASAG
ncbi:hypothetical protein [Streptomyces sp. NPDC001816]|uniref:hypothetical protein n=1 Tax=Streptomyces sp. NPDC001816 TaxID=3364612 RepID=UPI0036945D3A